MGLGHKWGSREELLHPRGWHGRFRTTPNHIVDRLMGILDAFNPRMFRDDNDAANFVHSRARTNRFLTNRKPEIDKFIGGYTNVQHGLRTGQLTPADQRVVATMDQGFSPTTEDLILNRVTGPEAFGLNQENFAHIQNLEGLLISDKGYSSTNIGTPQQVGGPHVTMVIAAPKGTKALMPSTSRPTREVILPRDQEYRVTKVDPDGQGGYNMMVVAMPKGEAKEAPETNAPEGGFAKPEPAPPTPNVPTQQEQQAPAVAPQAPAPAPTPQAPATNVPSRQEPIHAETVGAQPSAPTTPAAPGASTPPTPATVPQQRPDIRALVREQGLQVPSPGPRRKQWNEAYLGIASGKKHPEDILRELRSDIEHNKGILAEDQRDGTDSGPLPNDIAHQEALANLIQDNYVPVEHRAGGEAPGKTPAPEAPRATAAKKAAAPRKAAPAKKAAATKEAPAAKSTAKAAPAKATAAKKAPAPAKAAPVAKKAPAPAKAAPVAKKAAAPAPAKAAVAKKAARITASNVKPGDAVIWQAPGESPIRGRVVKEGRNTFIDWEGGRRERITHAVGAGPNVRRATDEEAKGLPKKVKTISQATTPTKAVAKKAVPEKKAAPAKAVAKKAVPEKKAAPATAPRKGSLAWQNLKNQNILQTAIKDLKDDPEANAERGVKGAGTTWQRLVRLSESEQSDRAFLDQLQDMVMFKRGHVADYLSGMIEKVKSGEGAPAPAKAVKKAIPEVKPPSRMATVKKSRPFGELGQELDYLIENKASRDVIAERLRAVGGDDEAKALAEKLAKDVEGGRNLALVRNEAWRKAGTQGLEPIGRAGQRVAWDDKTMKPLTKWSTGKPPEKVYIVHSGTKLKGEDSPLDRAVVSEVPGRKPPVKKAAPAKAAIKATKAAPTKAAAKKATPAKKISPQKALEQAPTPAAKQAVVKKAQAAAQEKRDTGARVKLWHTMFADNENSKGLPKEGSESRRRIDEALAQAGDPTSIRAQANKLDDVAKDLRTHAEEVMSKTDPESTRFGNAKQQVAQAVAIEQAARIMRETAGKKRTPKKAAPAKAAPEPDADPLAKASVPQVRAYAREKGITVPTKIRKKDDIIAHIRAEEKVAKAPTPKKKVEAAADQIAVGLLSDGKGIFVQGKTDEAAKALRGMTPDTLRKAAKAEGIEVPDNLKTKQQILSHVFKQLAAAELKRRNEVQAAKAAKAVAKVAKTAPPPEKVSLRTLMKDEGISRPDFIPAQRAISDATTELMGGKPPAEVARNLRERAKSMSGPNARKMEGEGSRILLDEESIRARQREGVQAVTRIAQALEKRARASSTQKLPIDAKHYEAQLKKFENADAARQFLDQQKLSLAQIRQLMTDLDIPSGGARTRKDLLEHIVQNRVQARINHQVLSKGGYRGPDPNVKDAIQTATKAVKKAAATAKVVKGDKDIDFKALGKSLDEVQTRDAAGAMLNGLSIPQLREVYKVRDQQVPPGARSRKDLVEGLIFQSPVGAKENYPEIAKQIASGERMQTPQEIMLKGEAANAQAPKPATKPILKNNWGMPGGEIHFHEDGNIGRAIQTMGDEKLLSVTGDGEPIANVLGRIATDMVRGNMTQQGAINQMENLMHRFPEGSKARRALDMAIERMSPPRKPLPNLPNGAPEPIQDLVRKLNGVPLARDDHRGSTEMQRVADVTEAFMSRYKDLSPEDQIKRYNFIANDLRMKVLNHRHESEEGKFEIDRLIMEAVKQLEELAAAAQKRAKAAKG